jgi:hypothetical protein
MVFNKDNSKIVHTIVTIMAVCAVLLLTIRQLVVVAIKVVKGFIAAAKVVQKMYMDNYRAYKAK